MNEAPEWFMKLRARDGFSWGRKNAIKKGDTMQVSSFGRHGLV